MILRIITNQQYTFLHTEVPQYAFSRENSVPRGGSLICIFFSIHFLFLAPLLPPRAGLFWPALLLKWQQASECMHCSGEHLLLVLAVSVSYRASCHV